MLKKIARALWHTEGMNSNVPDDYYASFVLTYNKLIIGHLSLEDGKWTFKYSDEFKKQKEVLPLSNFPDKNEDYASKELWPFFASRIPSAAQLEAKVSSVKNEERNEVNLLKKYGHKTITNPFTLQPQF